MVTSKEILTLCQASSIIVHHVKKTNTEICTFGEKHNMKITFLVKWTSIIVLTYKHVKIVMAQSVIGTDTYLITQIL